VLLDRVIDIQPRKSRRAQVRHLQRAVLSGALSGQTDLSGRAHPRALAQLIGVLAVCVRALDSSQKIMYFMASTARASAPRWCRATA